MKFDPTKPVRTRDGRPARIIATDAKGPYPIVALVTEEDGSESISWRSDHGHHPYWQEPKDDLINLPERHSRYFSLASGYLSPRAAASGSDYDVLEVTSEGSETLQGGLGPKIISTRIIPRDEALDE